MTTKELTVKKTTKTLSKYTNVDKRYEAFVHEYINNGFNATKAYMEVYKVKETSARSSSSQLLANINIKKELSKQLGKLGLEEYISREMVINDIQQLIDTTPNPNVKARMVELKAKIAGMLQSDTTINVGVFAGVEKQVDDIYLKRGV